MNSANQPSAQPSASLSQPYSFTVDTSYFTHMMNQLSDEKTLSSLSTKQNFIYFAGSAYNVTSVNRISIDPTDETVLLLDYDLDSNQPYEKFDSKENAIKRLKQFCTISSDVVAVTFGVRSKEEPEPLIIPNAQQPVPQQEMSIQWIPTYVRAPLNALVQVQPPTQTKPSN
jgi:hypothetical protein